MDLIKDNPYWDEPRRFSKAEAFISYHCEPTDFSVPKMASRWGWSEQETEQFLEEIAPMTIGDDYELLDPLSFEAVWDLYDKKTNKEGCKRKWDRLSRKDKEAVMAFIPRYKEAQPEKRYRKNFLTFLNQRSWEDEIIYSTEYVKRVRKEQWLRDAANELDKAFGTDAPDGGMPY